MALAHPGEQPRRLLAVSAYAAQLPLLGAAGIITFETAEDGFWPWYVSVVVGISALGLFFLLWPHILRRPVLIASGLGLWAAAAAIGAGWAGFAPLGVFLALIAAAYAGLTTFWSLRLSRATS
jgi:hypothetical protein